MKETYKTMKVNLPYRPAAKDLSAYRKLMQERGEEKKRDREIMFETAVPCVVFGVIAGMIIGELLLRVWVPTKHINLLKP